MSANSWKTVADAVAIPEVYGYRLLGTDGFYAKMPGRGYRDNAWSQLAMGTGSSFVVNNSGSDAAPLLVSTSDIPNPVDHALSEKYKFMLLRVENVQVGQMDLGKNGDNYELTNADGICWAFDDANEDLPPGGDYYVAPGQVFASVAGYLEQYLRPEQGWDYYQLLPRDAADYVPVATAVEVTTWGAVKSLFR